MGYHVRLAGPGDRASILSLVGELLPGAGRRELEQRFTWLYEDNPHGRAITWVAIDDASGETMGSTSFFPRRMIAGSRPVLGALGGDCFVRPRFRRRGIGAAMHAAGRRDMAGLGVAVMFGTPVPANVTPLAAVGSRDVTHVARYVRPLTLRPLGVPAGPWDRLAAAALSPRSRARLDPIAGRDGRVAAVWRAVEGSIGLATVRDPEMFAWRFTASPSGRQAGFVVVEGGSPLAVCALERVGQRLRIVELCAPPSRWGAALDAICQHARGCDAVEVRLTREQAAAHRILRRGFVERGGVMPLNVMLPEGDPGADVFWDPARWYVTWLETDQDTST